MKTLLISAIALMGLNAFAAKVDAADLLSRLHATNQDEVKAGELAKKKANNQKVRAYGEMLIREHADIDKSVMAMAKDKNLKLSSPKSFTPADMVTMTKHKETMAQLEAMPSEHFDEQFTIAMRDGHDDVIQLLKVTESDDADVNTFAKRLIPKLEEHRAQAARLVPISIKEAR